MLYVWIILAVTVILSVVNGVVVAPQFGFSPLVAVLLCIATVVVEIAINALVAFFIRHILPEKWFRKRDTKFFVFWFGVSKREKNFYEKIGIRKWKDKVPEVGKSTTGFSKNKIEMPTDNVWLGRYFMEVYFGEVIHLASAILGLLVVYLHTLFRVVLGAPWVFALTVCLPVALLGVCLNMPSYCILRYNSYRLEILYRKNEKKAKREESVITEKLG